MIGSTLAGMLSRVPLHPLDTIKACLQVQTGSVRGELQAVLDRARLQGIGKVLYRGFPIVRGRVALRGGEAGSIQYLPAPRSQAFFASGPASLLYFSSYEVSKSTISTTIPSLPSSLCHFSAGMLAETTSCLLWVPIDVIKERQQISAVSHVSESSHATSAVSTVRRILRTEGFRGLYRGYWATIASFGPFSALYFVFYESLKAECERMTGRRPGELLPLAWQIGAASTAGAAASVITNPLDLVKLRLQVQRAMCAESTPPWGTAYTGVVTGLRDIVHREGPFALFRGAAARVAFHAPSTALTLTLFEFCRDAAKKMLASA